MKNDHLLYGFVVLMVVMFLNEKKKVQDEVYEILALLSLCIM